MTISHLSHETVVNRDQLVSYFEEAAKPPSAWRIGTEHEKFPFRLTDYRPAPYEGPGGISALLERLSQHRGTLIMEDGQPIALRSDNRQGAITLEPGGQIELSGAPWINVHETCAEISDHLAMTREIGTELGLGMLSMGFQPKWRREDIPLMPKNRYRIMRNYMPKRGSLGLDMMLRSCTVQANLDFGNETDMVAKFRVGLALQPVATALFANSPFVEGRICGQLSRRAFVWNDTDPDRCGIPACVFEDGFGFERWVDYLLDVPMYFVIRNNRYHDVAGKSFRDFLSGRLTGFEGEKPLLSDFEDHLTAIFTDVRLKRFLEMRGADAGPWRLLCALPAFWVGLLYDRTALEETIDWIRDWRYEEVVMLRETVPKLGLATPFRKESVADIARRALLIAEGGLKRRSYHDAAGRDESHFLNDLMDIADRRTTLAEEKLARFYRQGKGDIDSIFQESIADRLNEDYQLCS